VCAPADDALRLGRDTSRDLTHAPRLLLHLAGAQGAIVIQVAVLGRVGRTGLALACAEPAGTADD
jgi:hypothetical protein